MNIRNLASLRKKRKHSDQPSLESDLGSFFQIHHRTTALASLRKTPAFRVPAGRVGPVGGQKAIHQSVLASFFQPTAGDPKTWLRCVKTAPG